MGTAKLSLVLPHVVKGKSGLPMRAVPGSNTVHRNPQYINPSPQPSSSLYAGNVLNIYVDGSFLSERRRIGSRSSALPRPDEPGGGRIGNHQPTALRGLTKFLIVVIEYDGNGNNLLAIGDIEASGQVITGTGRRLSSVTMQMNAQYIGITDDQAQTEFDLLQSGTFTSFTCPNSGQKFGLFTADAEGVISFRSSATAVRMLRLRS